MVLANAGPGLAIQLRYVGDRLMVGIPGEMKTDEEWTDQDWFQRPVEIEPIDEMTKRFEPDVVAQP